MPSVNWYVSYQTNSTKTELDNLKNKDSWVGVNIADTGTVVFSGESLGNYDIKEITRVGVYFEHYSGNLTSLNKYNYFEISIPSTNFASGNTTEFEGFKTVSERNYESETFDIINKNSISKTASSTTADIRIGCNLGRVWVRQVHLIIEFSINSYNLTVNSSEGGTVNNVSGVYESGASVQLIATPDAGYSFLKWSDENTNPNRTIKVTGNAVYTAYFKFNGKLYLGNKNIENIYVGSAPVKAVYIGTRRIY